MSRASTKKWADLSDIQQNAFVAENVMGWQWISFDFHDVYPMKGQLWLLPDAECVHEITNGEWTWYLEEEEVYPEGSLFPLPHKDKRIVPTWLPCYTKSMDTAWELVEKLGEKFDIRFYMEEGLFGKYCVKIWTRDGGRIAGAADSNTSMSKAICEAALKVYGVDIEQAQK